MIAPPTKKIDRPEPSLEIRAKTDLQKVKNTTSATQKIDAPVSLISKYKTKMFPLNLPSVVYCQQNNLLCYSAHASPFFDEKKGRVSKGKEFAKDSSDGFRTVPIKGLMGWSPDAIKKDNKDYTMVMMKTGFESGIVVIDLDICGGKTCTDTFDIEMLTRLHDDCGYFVQTGSGGFHFYFKIPEGKRWKRKMNVKTFAGYDTLGQLDILADGGGVILEGSHYTYQNIQYTYEQMNRHGEDRTMDDITEMPDWVLEAIEGCYEVKAEAVAEAEALVPPRRCSTLSTLLCCISLALRPCARALLMARSRPSFAVSVATVGKPPPPPRVADRLTSDTKWRQDAYS